MATWEKAAEQVSRGTVSAQEIVRELLPVFEELAERHFARLDHITESDGPAVYAMRTVGRRFIAALRAALGGTGDWRSIPLWHYTLRGRRGVLDLTYCTQAALWDSHGELAGRRVYTLLDYLASALSDGHTHARSGPTMRHPFGLSSITGAGAEADQRLSDALRATVRG